MSSMDEAQARAKFEAEYCPPLDPALLFSILSDYDLSAEKGRTDATNILDELRTSALIEEATEFDPSATTYDDTDGGTRTASRLEGSATSSRETDISSVSNDLGELDLSDTSNDGTLTPDSDPVDLDAIDEETKITLLLEVFRDKTTPYNVRHTLQKCNGRWDAAMEELLNQVGISDILQQESGTKLSNKGVDAFAEENGFRKGRKGKGKKKGQNASRKLQAGSGSSSPIDAPLPLKNRWHASGRDTEFVASRTGLPLAAIQSLYNSHGGSLPETITAILKTHSMKTSQEDCHNPVMVADAYDLGQDYPNIGPDHLFALVHITHPSAASARELAEELTARPKTPTGGIQIIPKYTKPALDDADSTWQKPKKMSRPSTPTEYHMPSTDNQSYYNDLRAAALQKARAAHRQSKSNPLFGGAAAYYSQEGRNLGALSSQAAARSADQLAARQSTSSSVDLHGVDVLNAVRIAQESVGQWWAGLGENRVNGRVGAESRQAGYRIVVGRGTHSVGGVGKLGPAVSKALKTQGWRIENQGAAILVKGR